MILVVMFSISGTFFGVFTADVILGAGARAVVVAGAGVVLWPLGPFSSTTFDDFRGFLSNLFVVSSHSYITLFLASYLGLTLEVRLLTTTLG